LKKILTSLAIASALSLTVVPASYADVVSYETPEDTTSPSITAIEFNQSTVNAGDTIRIYLTATDDLSGVLDVSFALRSPSGQIVTPTHENPVQQDAQGRFYADVPFSPYAEGGTWNVVQAVAVDNNFNAQEYLYGTNSPYTFQVLSSTPDTTFATLVGVELSKTVVPVTLEESFLIYIDATDNLSGVKSVRFTVNDPNGNTIQWSGTLQQDEAGRYFGYVGFPPGGPTGTYTISTITIQDNALNEHEYQPAPTPSPRSPSKTTH